MCDTYAKFNLISMFFESSISNHAIYIKICTQNHTSKHQLKPKL